MGVEGRVVYFIAQLYKSVSGTLKQITGSFFCIVLGINLFCTLSTKLLTEITYLQSRKYIVIAKIEHDSFEKFVKKNTICNFDFKMRATF